MRLFIFNLLLFLAINTVYAQTTLDSLKWLEGKEKIDAINKLALSNFNIDPDQSDSLALAALKLSRDLKYVEGQVDALKVRGGRLSIKFKLREANAVLNEALSLARDVGYEKGIATVNYTVGANYIRLGLYDLAAENFIEGLDAAAKLGVDAYKIGNLLNLGIVYVELKEFERAEKYLRAGLDLLEGVDLDLRKAQLIANLGSLELERGNYALSEKYYLQSTKDLQTLKAITLAAVGWINLGKINSHLGRGKVAITYLDSALTFAQERQDLRARVRVLNHKGRFLYRLNRYAESEEVLGRALALEEGYAENPKTLYELYELAVDLNKVKGDFAKALYYKNEAVEVRDSLVARSNREREIAITAKLEFDQLRNKVEIEAKNAQISQLKVEQRNLTILILSVLLLAALALYLLNRRRLRQKLFIVEKDKLLSERESELKSHELIKQEKLLKAYSDELSQIKLEEEQGSKSDRLVRLLTVDHLKTEDWATFRIAFAENFPEFFKGLANYHLTINEQRLASLIKLGLASKEVASILAITPKSVNKAKSRLASKLHKLNVIELENTLQNIS